MEHEGDMLSWQAGTGKAGSKGGMLLSECSDQSMIRETAKLSSNTMQFNAGVKFH